MTAANPSHATRLDPALELDAFVAAFESAAASGSDADLASFLPPASHPLRAAVLRELVRVDLEFAWSRGVRKFLEDYKGRFPELFHDPGVIRELIGEELRLRTAAGECPDSHEYHDRFGLDVGSLRADSRPTRYMPGYGGGQPNDRMPGIGDTLPPGYRLTNELGRVFLARESNLGDRPVVIKLSAQLPGEPVTLARLQHTNIVPILSAHRVGPYTALVMPFLGITTLGDVIASFRAGRAAQSGHGLVTTLADRATATMGNLADTRSDSKPVSSAGLSRASLEALDRMTFTEAVLWIGAELADGLAHAHDRGVLHRDIKPANVLFTEDGRPMLLDFNLASVETGRVAGTPAYMAPEQLDAALTERGLATPQTDIYALGLVLVQLLVGRLPFEEPHGRWEDVLPMMLAAKRKALLDALRFPPDVTPGVRAILAKCIDPDPTTRYQSAAELRDDLNRQRANQPLKYVREGSLRERVLKWVRRHPRLSSGGSIALAASIVVGILSTAYLANRWRLGIRDSELAHARLRDARESASSGVLQSPAGEWQAIRSSALGALEPYRVESDDWVDGPLVKRRPEAERVELRRDAAQLMFRTAEATAAIARLEPVADVSALAEALEWNRRARTAFPGPPTRPFLKQQAALLRALGQTTESTQAEREANRVPEASPDIPMELGFAKLSAGDYSAAADQLRAVSRSGPPRYSVWMGLAAAEQRRGRYPQAIDALSAASGLRPTTPWPFFHRGLARMEVKDYAGALCDFNRFLELKPDDADGLLNRAIVRLLTSDPGGAVADCDSAERHNSSATRLYAVREQAKRNLGDRAGADRDLAVFLAKKPTDSRSWCARGERKLAMTPRDPVGALADFEEALKLDPNDLSALRDQASVLAENPQRQAAAIEVLDHILRLVPDAVSDRAGRAVLLARVGKTEDALREVRACSNGAEDGLVLYQLASAALVANDKSRGLALLRTALRKEPAFAAQMTTDPDLQSVWKDAVFLNLTAAANTLTRE